MRSNFRREFRTEERVGCLTQLVLPPNYDLILSSFDTFIGQPNIDLGSGFVNIGGTKSETIFCRFALGESILISVTSVTTLLPETIVPPHL